MSFTLLTTINEEADSEAAVLAQIKSAKKKSTDRENTVGFALEDDDGKIVKVFVRAEQADDFERALGREQYEDDGNEKEIAEILFKLRKEFDIVDVEWQKGTIPEDEEVDNELGGEEGDGDGDLDPDALGGSEEGDAEGLDLGDEDLDGALDAAETGGTDDTYSALQSVIDMLKSNAEAEKAKAEAEKAKAEAEVAKAANNAAKLRAEQEEEILDMEEFNKRKKEEEEISKTRQELIKYRHERKHASKPREELGESMKGCKYDGPTPEEEELLDMEKWEEEEKERKRTEKERERLIRFRHEKKKKRHEEEEKMRKRVHRYMEGAKVESVKDLTFQKFLDLNKDSK